MNGRGAWWRKLAAIGTSSSFTAITGRGVVVNASLLCASARNAGNRVPHVVRLRRRDIAGRCDSGL